MGKIIMFPKRSQKPRGPILWIGGRPYRMRAGSWLALVWQWIVDDLTESG